VVLIKQYGSWYIILNKEVRDRSAIANLPEI
jgi:hypothetical protein